MTGHLSFSGLVASSVAAVALVALLAVPFSELPDGPGATEIRLRAPRIAGNVLTLETEPPSREALLSEDRAAPQNAPLRVAVAAETHLDLLSAPAAPGRRARIHRVAVRSPGASSISVAFETFRLPAGAELRLTADATSLGPYTALDAVGGELWTPALPGDRLTIELHVAHAAAFEPTVVLTRIHHGYRAIGIAAGALDGERANGTCHVDAACGEDPALEGAIRSVAVYTVLGTHTCTGQLVDSTAPGPTPYFLTADHCGVTRTNAHTVRVYWNVASPVCGARCCGDRSLSQSGAVVRARYAATDMCLLELLASPPNGAGAYLTGWDARESASPRRTTAVHHPRGAEKAISINEDPLTPASYLTDGPGDGTHLRVDDWEVGTTEPGSSGSGLWNEAGRLIGQLHGGYAACEVPLPDWYGRLSRSWEGGGTPATRLRDWLDPLGVTGRVRDGRPFSPVSVEPPPPVTPAGRLLAPVPNPTPGGTTLRWEIETPGRVEVTVIDVRGRHISTLAQLDAAQGSFARRWDGRLASGAPAPPGVYIVRLAHEGRTVSGAKVIVRR